MSIPIRGSGTTTWQAFAMLSYVIKERKQVEVPMDVSRLCIKIIEMVGMRGIDVYYRDGKYFLTCTFGSAYVEDTI